MSVGELQIQTIIQWDVRISPLAVIERFRLQYNNLSRDIQPWPRHVLDTLRPFTTVRDFACSSLSETCIT